MSRSATAAFVIVSIPLMLGACFGPSGGAGESLSMESIQSPASSTLTPPATITPTPQSISSPSAYGPDGDDFPPNYNPLSGQEVEDPSLLKVPAMLVSISHFPPVARPQAGLSFAPCVIEFYITEGATRFLAVFHGEYPKPEVQLGGNCEVRSAGFTQETYILGNRVWLDKNRNGRQDPYEPGVGGVCVRVMDESGKQLEETTTDSNGFYGFNLEQGKYSVEFDLPDWLEYTEPDVGDENGDSDANPLTGRAEADIHSSYPYLDAGLVASKTPPPTPRDARAMPKAEIGPIRSGRLIHADIAGFFQSSCLIYAFADEKVLAEIPKCSFVKHEDRGGGSMIELERFTAIAEDNMKHTRSDFMYASNLFSEAAPPGGSRTEQIDVYVAYLNQSGWKYDPLSESWLRYVDQAEESTAGQLHAEVDRLTGRQLSFENVAFIFVEHDVVSPTNLDIHLEQGDEGYAFLFRDGLKYDIRWSTRSGEYEQRSGLRRPLQFLYEDGKPFPLRPGSTWIFVATPYSVWTNEEEGHWRLRYFPPQGAK